MTICPSPARRALMAGQGIEPNRDPASWVSGWIFHSFRRQPSSRTRTGSETRGWPQPVESTSVTGSCEINGFLPEPRQGWQNRSRGRKPGVASHIPILFMVWFSDLKRSFKSENQTMIRILGKRLDFFTASYRGSLAGNGRTTKLPSPPNSVSQSGDKPGLDLSSGFRTASNSRVFMNTSAQRPLSRQRSACRASQTCNQALLDYHHAASSRYHFKLPASRSRGATLARRPRGT